MLDQRKGIALKDSLELVGAHACFIIWVVSLIEEHVSDYSASPYVNCLGIRGAAEYLRSHVKQGSALCPHIGVLMLLQLGGESEVCDFDGREIGGVS